MALDFGKLNFSVSFNPTSAFPLDARSYFESYAEAEAAARIAEAAGSTNSIYYYGQTVAVVENGMANFYIIQPDKTLQPLTGGENNTQIKINPSLFEYDENGQLTLKGFASAETGQYLSINENGEIIWITPDTYTKEETDEKISKAVAAADHLKRKIVSNIDEARDYINNNDDADQYIYMVPTGFQENDDKYDEYVVIRVADVPMLEKVGSWEVDLSDYAKTSDLDSKVDNEEGSRLIHQSEIEKLESLKNSPFKSVNESHFELDSSGKLNFTANYAAIDGLQAVLDTKIDKKEGYTLLSPTDKDKLDKLVLSGDDLQISGSVNAEKVVGLGEWITNNGPSYIEGLTENNLGPDLIDKINFITSVDRNIFTVTNGKLELNPQDGSRLITPDEISILEQVAGGDYDNYIRSVDTDVFSVSNGKLNLVAIPNAALFNTVGDLTQLITYNENTNTTIVNEINALYEMLHWKDMI